MGTKSLKALYAKVREMTRRKQGDKPVAEIIKALNPQLQGWGNYHRRGQNVGMFTKLDKWVRNRLRSYIHGRWRTIRWPGKRKPTKEEFDQMGLFAMRRILRPEALQLMLF
ncbi:MAG: group II intron maturase-specific domain-containing protein [Desulfuromonadales bacterium]|nr:group II intron maturase-specific domain-containing protein [Desulfuromonadales bacterium]